MKKILIDLYLIDTISISYSKKNADFLNNFIYETVSSEIKKTFKDNNITTENDTFSFGLYFFSNFLQEIQFNKAIKYFNSNNIEFFDPAIFTNNIPNYITNKICEKIQEICLKI